MQDVERTFKSTFCFAEYGILAFEPRIQGLIHGSTWFNCFATNANIRKSLFPMETIRAEPNSTNGECDATFHFPFHFSHIEYSGAYAKPFRANMCSSMG